MLPYTDKGCTEVTTPADSRTAIGSGDSCIFPHLSSRGFMLRTGERAGRGAVPVQSGKEQEGCMTPQSEMTSSHSAMHC